MLEITRALDQRLVAGLIFRALRNVVPDQSGAMRGLLIDANDAIAGVLEEGNNLAPAGRVVPVFALRRALCTDADVGLSDRTAVIGNVHAWRSLGRVDA